MKPFSWIVGGLRNCSTPCRETIPKSFLQVSNLTRQTVLATRMELADSAPKRNRGLLGRGSLAPGEGLWIVPCESIHTFFMQFPIDLVYLDRERRIKKLRSEVPPWRISVCLTAHSILELPAGTICSTQTQAGDTRSEEHTSELQSLR